MKLKAVILLLLIVLIVPATFSSTVINNNNYDQTIKDDSWMYGKDGVLDILLQQKLNNIKDKFTIE